MVPSDSNYSTIHTLFGESWRVENESDWLFDLSASMVSDDVNEQFAMPNYDVSENFTEQYKEVS